MATYDAHLQFAVDATSVAKSVGETDLVARQGQAVTTTVVPSGAKSHSATASERR